MRLTNVSTPPNFVFVCLGGFFPPANTLGKGTLQCDKICGKVRGVKTLFESTVNLVFTTSVTVFVFSPTQAKL